MLAFTKKIGQFYRLSKRRKFLLLITLILSVYTYFLMKYFKKYALFGKKIQEINQNNSNEVLAADFAFAIRIIDKYVPWENVCRHQAYQAKLLCKVYRIPYLIYVGVKKNEQGLIEGHAWTMLGNKIITGYCKQEEYTILSIYSS